MKKILITGGAGFVGSSLAITFKQHHQDCHVICLDNLSRRGSELNLTRLREQGVEFVHGDVRNSEDLAKIKEIDWLIECSAEPSVHAGYGDSPAYLMNTNLLGLINCLEYLRQYGGKMAFLSTSRVYPIQALRALPLKIENQRFELDLKETVSGLCSKGIAEHFSIEGFRSLYGATKLCGELLIHEYSQMYGIPAIINRCGVLAGPWQMGKVDQGFMALWVARHVFGGGLKYMGFGGEGMQVRDVLHVNDLYQLLLRQMCSAEDHQGAVYNVGGGYANSLSLCELTAIVSDITGKQCQIDCDPQTREADIPYYVTDITKVNQKTQWAPQIKIPQIVEEIDRWMCEHKAMLAPIFTA
ncbi:NAD-dependent epimerase/dehydratase family protein [Candidatus Berkiella aquae]|uniref:CDP-paratose 2-epimerase n=1 Tax=Candidatus Berkiella aquae TaxID=295108 RepID=A0A0Q9Z0E5_9GAMM|nr:NAD-dependent epimerase/dehydratase family protein [Candidatus Berkiella aquae]MCS5712138.1 NAD-dependent epimerase/dehydratase family protein [Candidatus Berkiella aquae]